MSSDPGITISSDVRITFDWPRFIEKMTEVFAQGFATAFGISHGISALISAIGSLRVDAPPGARAWEVFCLSLAWAFDNLCANTSADELDANKAAIIAALRAAQSKVDAGTYVMSQSFLTTPSSLPLYKLVRDELVDQRTAFREGQRESAEIVASRFDSAFNRAVFEVWSRNAEKFQPVAIALNAPGASASAFEREWDAYRQTLIFDFDVRPVFGQEESKVSLSQLYVPLRGYWQALRDDNETLDESIHSDRVCHVESLDEMLEAWINTRDNDDNLRLIGGGPGSGKSTTLKCLASRLAGRPDLRPLYIPLQHIDIGQDLRSALNAFFVTRTNGAFRQSPLSREAIENGPRPILLFDGLDELARPGEGAAEVASLFVNKLTQLMSSLGVASYVVSGRMPFFQAARKHLSATGTKSYSVCGYLPVGAQFPNAHGVEALVKTDQRRVWWRKYSTTADESEAFPQAMGDQRFADVTNEPLLCYLLALSGYATSDWQEALDNRNRIYARLISEVWARGWGEGSGKVKRQGPGRGLTQPEFVKLMETIALAAWRGGDTRVASEERFIEATRLSKTEAIWTEFKKTNGPDVGNLALNFYLKSTESDQRGFEFTHKSFGDYLVACSLCTLAFELPELINHGIELVARAWLSVAGEGDLSVEILNFLRDEMRLRTEGNVSRLGKVKDCFEASRLLH
jgi:hypothetical protein